MIRLIILLLLIPANVIAAINIDINLELNKHELINQKAILENLSLYRLRDSTLLNEQYLKQLQQKGVTEIKTALQTFSYYQPNIKTTLSAGDEPNAWNIDYNIQLGPALRIRDISLRLQGEGEKDKALRLWLDNYPLQPGSPLIHETYETAKKQLLRVLRDRGYFKSALEKHQIQVNLKDYHADITLYVITGPRHVFGDLEFKQLGFSLNYLSRFLPFQQGDPFEAAKLQLLQQNFVKSGQFELVEIEPKVQHISGRAVPIEIRLVPKKRTKYSIGLGFGTDTGVRGLFNIDRRYVNKNGHHMELDTLASRVKAYGRINYSVPLKAPVSDFLALSASRTIEDTDTVYRQTNAVALNLTHLYFRWRQSLGVSYETERFEVGDDSGESELLIPNISWLYARNLQPQTQKSIDRKRIDGQFSINLKGASSAIVSDTSFAQSLINIKLRLRLSDPLAIVSRATIGLSTTPEFEELPASLRFFAGGDQSIRGFRFNSLGPSDENGETIGGENLLVGSVELQHKFTRNWDVAAFMDAGNAFDDDQFKVEQGAGVGVGWRFPFGALRLYAANAISDDDRPWRFHLLVGAEL